MLKTFLTLGMLVSVLGVNKHVEIEVTDFAEVEVNDVEKELVDTIAKEIISINTTTVIDTDADNLVLVPKINNDIINIISKAEVAGVDTLYGDNIYKGKYMPKGHKKLSKTPVKKLVSLQKKMLELGSENTPIGICQFNMKTLEYLIDSGKLNERKVFDNQTQRLLCSDYLKVAKIDKWLDGKISTDNFINRLASKWASIPTTNGKSRYGQRVGVKLNVLRKELKMLKQEYSSNGNVYINI